MINKLIYMFRRDLNIYIITAFIFIDNYLQISNILIFALIWGLIAILFPRTYDKFDILLLFQTSRKEYYVSTVIYNLLSSAIISLLLARIKVNSNNIPKNYFKYVFLFHFTLALVLFSTRLFNELFKHSDYPAVRFGVMFLYYVTFIPGYFLALLNNNFINFNKNLDIYQNFKLSWYYIMSFAIIGFNYITSYLVYRSTEIEIKGEAE